MIEGLVTKAIAGFFYITVDDKVYECRASTKLKRNKQKILPGDIVLFEKENLYIKEIKDRSNELIRPKIANVSGAILVFSLVEPNMNFGLLDRMLLIMEINNLSSLILLTKKDICNLETFNQLKNKINYYNKIGYDTLYNNDVDNGDQLKLYLKYDKYILTGQSGVGKSTFLNKIIPEANAKTQEISKGLGRGKHTTRETIFYKLSDDIYMIDTPGFSSLDLNFTKEQIRDNFIDFSALANGCRFNGCYHINEPGCNIKKSLENNEILKSRYENYKKLIEEIK